MNDYHATLVVSFDMIIGAETPQDADLVIRKIIYEVFKVNFSRARNLNIINMNVHKED